ncbi:MAG: T9SS type A sorting domain-containing protein [Flavobacteriales bacterium]|nr:T9SS type A sorting domain-containing protein [Flavobacteriales bacterium]
MRITSTLLLILPTVLSAQVNDLCSSVTPDALAVGNTIVWTGDNTGATIDDDYVAGTPFANSGIPAVWHAFTTTACTDITIDYCGSDASWNEFWNALLLTCPGSNSFIPTPQYNYTECPNGNGTMHFLSVPAGTYYYPVWTEDPGGIGPYTINVTAVDCGGSTAVNDNCGSVTADALAIGGAITLSGDVTFATSTGDFAAGSPYSGAPVVWHAFTTTECAKVTLSYCGLDPAWTNSLGFFARDCPASDLVLFSSYNNTDCVDGNRTYIFNQLAAGTYYVPVLLDPNDNANGPYDLLLQAEACPTAPTYSDFCSQVQYQSLAVGASLNLIGDNSNATATGDFVVGSPFAGAPVVWHGITVTECANISVAYCGLDPVWDNTFGFLAVECPVASPILFTTFNNTDCAEGNRTYFFNNVQPGDYLIPVVRDEANNAVGPYTLVVAATSCPVVPPANNDCTNVTAEALDIGAPLTFSGDNTNATSTGDFVAGSPFVAAPVLWHAFTTTECVDLVLAYCGQAPIWGNTLGFLTSSCPGDALVYYSSTNTTACNDGNTTYFFDDLPAGTYYVPVLRDAANGAIGPYSINVTAENCLFLAVDAMARPAISIRPNPSNGDFFIENVPTPGMELVVMDATGRVVHRDRTSVSGIVPLALAGRLAPGPYLVVLSNDRVRIEQRFHVR